MKKVLLVAILFAFSFAYGGGSSPSAQVAAGPVTLEWLPSAEEAIADIYRLDSALNTLMDEKAAAQIAADLTSAADAINVFIGPNAREGVSHSVIQPQH